MCIIQRIKKGKEIVDKITNIFTFPEINETGHFILYSVQKAGKPIEFTDLTWLQRHGLEVKNEFYRFDFTDKKGISSLIYESGNLDFYFDWYNKPSWAEEVIPVNSQTLERILKLLGCKLVESSFKIKYVYYEKCGILYYKKKRTLKPYGYWSNVKSNSDLKGQHSRTEKHNFERTFKKRTRQLTKKEILELIKFWDKESLL
jgi:hypothetical protein